MRALYDLAAPAKLNLFLHVVGRRPDGYHLLQSHFVLIDWCDTLHVERRPDGRLARHDLGSPLPADDLCLRAARLLQAESATAWGADISILKSVPWGAGMGGGSSDAATTLLALNRLWNLDWSRERLLALGLRLGADVPFFIGGRNAIAEGIGERLSPVVTPPQWLAVVKPPAAIETKAIFASPLLVRDSRAAILAGSADVLQEVLQPGFGRNDLQAAAESECAQVTAAVALLQQQFGNSRMTGSGSAVFARAGSTEQPPAAVMPPLPDAWLGRVCRSLVEHPLLGWCAD